MENPLFRLDPGLTHRSGTSDPSLITHTVQVHSDAPAFYLPTFTSQAKSLPRVSSGFVARVFDGERAIRVRFKLVGGRVNALIERRGNNWKAKSSLT